MALTDAQCKAAKPAPKQYQLVDADGLELLVTPKGAKVWRLRYRTQAGDRKRVTIGKYPNLGVSAARAEASKLRSHVWAGGDPATERAAKRVQGETLAEVVAQYVAENRPAWKDSTARTYLSAIKTFTAWADSAKVRLATDLNSTALAKYRAHTISLKRRVKAKGGSRRDVVSTGAPRSASAINCELRAIKTMLQTLRKAGRLPAISSSDEITDNLGLLQVGKSPPDPLKPAALRKLLLACKRHDAEMWTLTRVEASGEAPAGSTPKYEPITPLAIVMLLSGMRLGEALALTWDDVDLDEHLIRVRSSKTGSERKIDLSVSPALHRLLSAMRGEGYVFPGHTQATALAARLRLIGDYGAPDFLWSVRNSRPGERSAPTLRSTCGCYLTCAPSIFGAASVYRSAVQLGHSVQVAERHYLGALRKIPKDATTLEAAMEIEVEIDEPISATYGEHKRRAS